MVCARIGASEPPNKIRDASDARYQNLLPSASAVLPRPPPPIGGRAVGRANKLIYVEILERAMGFEPTTPTLARSGTTGQDIFSRAFLDNPTRNATKTSRDYADIPRTEPGRRPMASAAPAIQSG